MANRIRPVYYLSNAFGQFPQVLPYYEKLGGLVFVDGENTKLLGEAIYKGLNITTDINVVTRYNPNIIIYTDYFSLIKTPPNVKHIMIFHAIEFKGYFAIDRPWNLSEKYDLCLLYGNRILEEFNNSKFNPKYKIIGYPRFDNIVSAIKIFDNDKKTVLVAPTWSDESLLHKFVDSIIELLNYYNVIIKPHPNSITRAGDNNGGHITKLLTIKDKDLEMVGDPNILPYMEQSDILLTDYSGVSAEYMFFNKPVIICDPKCLPTGIAVNPDIWDVFKVCENPSDLHKMIKTQLINDEMKEERNNYFKKLVYTEEGSTATERGIKAIEELLEAKK